MPRVDRGNLAAAVIVPPPANQVTVNFTTNDAWTGKYHILNTAETFSLAGGGGGSPITVATHSFDDGTVVTVEMLNVGSTPFCVDPGQSYSILWSTNNIFTNCISGFVYKVAVTLNFVEADTGFIHFNPFA